MAPRARMRATRASRSSDIARGYRPQCMGELPSAQVSADVSLDIITNMKSKTAKGSREDLVELLDEMDREFGPPSKEAYAWADRVLGLSSSTPVRSSLSNART